VTGLSAEALAKVEGNGREKDVVSCETPKRAILFGFNPIQEVSSVTSVFSVVQWFFHFKR